MWIGPQTRWSARKSVDSLRRGNQGRPVATFEQLCEEAAAVPVEGWDFSWFQGRATEQRPFWGYSQLLGERMGAAECALDLQTGGGEVLAAIPKPPPRLIATEGWAPNAALARQRLAPIGGEVVEVAEDADLPFTDGTFDLVMSRHPVSVRFEEVARVLTSSGIYLSQQVGAGSVRELTDAMMGPQPVSDARRPDRAVAAATAAGLVLVNLQAETLRMEFFDIAAVIVFLRKVIWIVPHFTIEAYRTPLRALHQKIQGNGPFIAHAQRFLIEAQKPAVQPG
jgi:SAM-dependent methyltransferase